MTLAPSPDPSDAGWIVNSARPWQQLVGFGPEGFAAHARLRFLPDPASEGMSESRAEPETDLSEAARLRIALLLLARHTRSPEDLCFAWWDGWGTDVAGLSVTALEHSRFHVPNRSYFLAGAGTPRVEAGQRARRTPGEGPPTGRGASATTWTPTGQGSAARTRPSSG